MSRTSRAPSRRDIRGMTLIELMVVVVIVGILAAIAYPSYQRQVQQTRRAEGQAALLQAAQQLERCFTRFNAYNDGDCDIDADIQDGGLPSGDGWYLITNTNRGARTFTLQAAPQGAQASDTRCANLTLTHTGATGASGTEPARCW